jgi:hypothetical protein
MHFSVFPYMPYAKPILLGVDILIVFGKAKQSRYTPRRRLGERRYSSYSFLTSVVE